MVPNSSSPSRFPPFLKVYMQPLSLLRTGVMKRNRLSRPGQGPASRAVTPKPATPQQGTGHQLAATRAYACRVLKHGEEKAAFRSRTPAVQTVPIQPLTGWVPTHRAQLLGCPLSTAAVLMEEELYHHSPPARASTSIATSPHPESATAASPVTHPTQSEREGTDKRDAAKQG